MIRVENLVKRFGRTLAVDRVSFEVREGEVVGFLGPNGAGKTTTIRVLTCYHPATAGTASVAGHDVFSSAVDVRRNIGYLPENVPIYPDLRVEEYLRYRAELKGVPRRERKVAVGFAMERCGVLDVRRKLVGHVSRGYRQRVGLADALVARPKILILDEPTSGLDPNQRRRMKTLIRDLAAEHTVLFSSHILAEVADVSSRILIINQGRLCADGTLDELLTGASGRALVVTAALPAGHDASLIDVVRGVDGIADAAAVGAAAGEEGATPDAWTTVRAPVAADVDPRDAVFTALSAAGARIRELKLDLPSLEQFFHDVTERADDAAADGGVAAHEEVVT